MLEQQFKPLTNGSCHAHKKTTHNRLFNSYKESPEGWRTMSKFRWRGRQKKLLIEVDPSRQYNIIRNKIIVK